MKFYNNERKWIKKRKPFEMRKKRKIKWKKYDISQEVTK